ncbi:MAG: segregation/condensation protein A [Nanoarchaeota archaeon]
MQQQLMTMLLEQDDVSWKSIIYELVEKEEMNPWDIDVTMLTQKYLLTIKEMQEHDFRISGKILLAAAFLLKIKAAYLVEHDISNLDKLFNQTEEMLNDDELLDHGNSERSKDQFTLIPRQPQSRTRKLSVHDLVEALERAMKTKKRILAQYRPVKFNLPQRKIDIMGVIRELYFKIVYRTEQEKKDTISFTGLLPANAGKHEKVYAFIPLLHLENEHKVETTQEGPFEEIWVKLLRKGREF